MIVQTQKVELIEYCSYRSNYQDAIARSTGVEKICVPLSNDSADSTQLDDAWMIENSYKTEELIISVADNTFIDQIQIHVLLNADSITKIEMLEKQRKQWLTMWTRRPAELDETSTNNIFAPLLRRYHLKTNTIRLTIDPSSFDRVAIRSILILGSSTFNNDWKFNSISSALHNIYQTTLDENNGDVQFSIDGQIINAHRHLLYCRSSYFRSLLLGDFKERTSSEPIQIFDVDEETFREVLYFIYHGSFRREIPCDTLIKCMIYCNKIDLLSGKYSAIEDFCLQLNVEHELILSAYCLAKKNAPAFDNLLEHIYDICTSDLKTFFQREDFSHLDKSLMLDLICNVTERRESRDHPKTNTTTTS